MKTGYPGQERMFRFVVTNSPILSSNLKTMTMKRNALILIMTAAVILTGLAFTLNSSASVEKKKEVPACCQSGSACPKESNQKSGSGELIMENMSRQFMSI